MKFPKEVFADIDGIRIVILREEYEELIKKHSNEGDIVMDTFIGGGTTAIACKNTGRSFKGCEVSKEYYGKVATILGL